MHDRAQLTTEDHESCRVGSCKIANALTYNGMRATWPKSRHHVNECARLEESRFYVQVEKEIDQLE
jgi:hypothetical protein